MSTVIIPIGPSNTLIRPITSIQPGFAITPTVVSATYTLSTSANGDIANLSLIASTGSACTVQFVGNGSVNVSSNDTTIIITGPAGGGAGFDLIAGTGVTLSNTGSNVTISIGQIVGTASNVSFHTVTANLVGTASNADVLTTGRAFIFTGDVTGSNTFDGSSNVTLTLALANTTVTPADYGNATHYTTFTVDSKGRLTAAGAQPLPTFTDTNTTYDLTLGSNASSANISLVGSDATSDNVTIVGTGAVTVSSNGTYINIDAPVVVDTDTTYGLSVLANTTAGSNVRLSSSNSVNTEVRFVGSGAANVQSNTTAVTINVPVVVDTDTTYTLGAPANTTSANVRLTSSGSVNNDVKIAGSGSVTVSANSSNGITISGTDTDTTYLLSTLANTTAGANVRLTSSGNVNTDVKIIGSGLANVSANSTVITVAVPAPTDNNTTYTLTTSANDTIANVSLIGSDASVNTVRFTGNGAVNVISNATHVLITAPTSGGSGQTYVVSALATTGGANLRLTSSDSTNDDVSFVGSGTVTVSQANTNTIVITGAAAAASPGGANTQVQYNDSGVLGGAAGFTYDKTTNNIVASNTFTVSTALATTVNATTITTTSVNATSVNTSTANATTSLVVGANVIANTTTLFVGNSTVNASHTSTQIRVANSTASANINPNAVLVGTSVVNTTVVAAGANVIANTTALYVGNSTVNATYTSTQLCIANSTTSANISSIGLVTGTSTVNTTVIAAGANVIANTTAVYVGNSTVNVVVTQTAVTLANSTSNTRLTVPSAAQYAATNAFLHANGTWVQPTDIDTTYSLSTPANTTSGNVRLTSSGSVNTDVKFVGTGLATVNSDGTTITIAVPAPTDLNTTYDLTLGAANTTVANLNLVGSDATTDTIRVTGNGIVNVISNATHVIVSAPAPAAAQTYVVNAVAATGGANVRLTSSGGTDDDIKLANGTGITITATDSNTITIASTIVDNDTTYTLGAPANTTSANVRLTSSGSVNNDVKIAGSGSVTVAANSTNGITITGTDNDTTYSLSTLANTTSANVRLSSSGLVNADVRFVGSGIATVNSNGTDVTINVTAPTDNNTTYTLSLAGANNTIANLNLNATGPSSTNTVLFTGNGAVNVISNATHIIVSAPTSAGGSGTRVYERFTVSASANTFTVTGGLANAYIDVYYNGVHLANTEYSSNSTAIQLLENGVNNSIVEVVGYKDLNAVAPAATGANTQIQFNDSGLINATAGFTFDKTTNVVAIANTLTIGGVNAATVAARDSVANNNTLVGTRGRINFIQGTNITLAVSDDSAGGQVNVQISSTAAGDTYTVSAVSATGGANVRLTSSTNANDDVKFANGTGITITRTDANTITISSFEPPRSLSIASPSSSEKIALLHTAYAMTVTEIRSIVSGTTPSVTFSIRYGTDYSAAGTEVVTSGLTCTNVTTGNVTTSFNNASIPANNFVWLTTTATSGTVTLFNVTVKF